MLLTICIPAWVRFLPHFSLHLFFFGPSNGWSESIQTHLLDANALSRIGCVQLGHVLFSSRLAISIISLSFLVSSLSLSFSLSFRLFLIFFVDDPQTRDLSGRPTLKNVNSSTEIRFLVATTFLGKDQKRIKQMVSYFILRLTIGDATHLLRSVVHVNNTCLLGVTYTGSVTSLRSAFLFF